MRIGVSANGISVVKLPCPSRGRGIAEDEKKEVLLGSNRLTKRHREPEGDAPEGWSKQ